MNSRHILRFVTALLLSGLCWIANGQTTASVFGVVRDASGAVVLDAKVTARNTDTAFTRTGATDGTGAFLITNLPVGPYSLQVIKVGFRSFVQDGITLQVNDASRVDAVLSVGQVNDTVEVAAVAVAVDTRSTSVGGVVDRLRVQELPLNGRNVMALARTIPGIATASAPTIELNARGGPGISVAGGRNNQNEIRFDGSSHVALYHNSPLNLPSPDALQEFKVLTSGFSAEYGRFGGGVFIAVTRAGTNQYHGSAWEFLRNKALNARNFFATNKPDLKQNQFGFTFGGPVNKDRTFFFGSYQGTRIRTSRVVNGAIPPTVAERAGDFSASARKPVDPLTGLAFPNAQIPSTRFDRAALGLMEKYVPFANTPSGGYTALSPVPSNSNQFLLRVDHNFSDRNNLNLRLFREFSDTTSASSNIAPHFDMFNPAWFRVVNYALNDTHTFSPSLLNEFRIGVNRNHSQTESQGPNQLSDFGAILPGVVIPQLPQLTVTGFFGITSGDAFGDPTNVYLIGDVLRYTRGRHLLSFGGEFTRNEFYGNGRTGNSGRFNFNGQITNNAFADYLIGRPISFSQNSVYERQVKGYSWYMFLQDEVRLTSRLTMNAGLRWEWMAPYHNQHDMANSYREGQQSSVVPNAPRGMVFPGDPALKGLGNRFLPSDKNNFAPRLGFAWDVTGDGKWAVKASYGLFFENYPAGLWTYAASNQPFVILVDINGPHSLSDPYRGQNNPFPFTYAPNNAKFFKPMGLFTILRPDVTAPYIHQLSGSVERALPGGIVVNVGYSGKLSHNLVRMNEVNPAIYIPGGSTIANTHSRRRLAADGYGSFRTIQTTSNATYHSAQFSINKRVTHGLTANAAYTFSKFLDYFAGNNIGTPSQDPFDMRADRGRSDYDRRHNFNMSIVYQIPEFSKQWLARKALGGWQVSSLTSIVSGAPINVTTGVDASLTGNGQDRPDLVGVAQRQFSSRADTIQQYFNAAAFVPNQPGRYGNLGRNALSGLTRLNTDVALAKSFSIGDRFGAVQFRAEAYNALNQVSLNNPVSARNNQNFGRIQGAGDPRILQVALRYSF